MSVRWLVALSLVMVALSGCAVADEGYDINEAVGDFVEDLGWYGSEGVMDDLEEPEDHVDMDSELLELDSGDEYDHELHPEEVDDLDEDDVAEDDIGLGAESHFDAIAEDVNNDVGIDLDVDIDKFGPSSIHENNPQPPKLTDAAAKKKAAAIKKAALHKQKAEALKKKAAIHEKKAKAHAEKAKAAAKKEKQRKHKNQEKRKKKKQEKKERETEDKEDEEDKEEREKKEEEEKEEKPAGSPKSEPVVGRDGQSTRDKRGNVQPAPSKANPPIKKDGEQLLEENFGAMGAHAPQGKFPQAKPSHGKLVSKGDQKMVHADSREHWEAERDTLGRLPMRAAERKLPPQVREEVGELKRQNTKLKFLLNRALRTEERLADVVRKHQGEAVPGYKAVFGSSNKLGQDMFAQNQKKELQAKARAAKAQKGFNDAKFKKTFAHEGRVTKQDMKTAGMKPKAASATRASALVQENTASTEPSAEDAQRDFNFGEFFAE